MPATQTSNGAGKRMEYKPVEFDVNEIAPDAPEGEWTVSIPRGKIRVQPTKEDHYPMLVVPIRLDKTEEDGDVHQKALGTEITLFLVFGGKNPRAERMSKLRLRTLCEKADVDLDVIPKKITDPENDLADLISQLEGKKFQAWTRHNVRRDTGETSVEIQFNKPGALKAAANDDDAPPARASSSKKGVRR